MVACWHGLMTVVRSLSQDSLGVLHYGFTSTTNLGGLIQANAVRPSLAFCVPFDARRLARHNQRTGEIVLIPPGDLSPCFVERQSLASDCVAILEIKISVAIISEIQTHSRSPTNQVKESVNDLGRLFGRHGNFVSFAHGVINRYVQILLPRPSNPTTGQFFRNRQPGEKGDASRSLLLPCRPSH